MMDRMGKYYARIRQVEREHPDHTLREGRNSRFTEPGTGGKKVSGPLLMDPLYRKFKGDSKASRIKDLRKHPEQNNGKRHR